MGECILVVEDDPASLKLLRLLLLTEGYEVMVAGSAEEASDLLHERLPRVLLLDLRLPGMSGLEFARQLKADPVTRRVQIIAVTASAMRGDEALALAAGCDAYMAKPVESDALLALVARGLNDNAGENPP